MKILKLREIIKIRLASYIENYHENKKVVLIEINLRLNLQSFMKN